jgi:hypothetical protein
MYFYKVIAFLIWLEDWTGIAQWSGGSNAVPRRDILVSSYV